MRIALDSPFDPTDFGTFRRQETTLIVLNLGVLAALASMHVAFVSLLGPPPRAVLVAIAARFVEQTLVLAWLQGRTDALPAAIVRLWAHVSTWVGLGFGLVVISLGTYEDSHYPVLFVLPLLSAAFRFSLPSALGVTLARVGDDHRPGLGPRLDAPADGPERVLRVGDDGAGVLRGDARSSPCWCRGLRRPRTGGAAHADELQRTRDRLVAEEKFAAVGRLASAVAHEIRNPVAMIVTSLSQATKPPRRRGPAASELFDIASREAGTPRARDERLSRVRPTPAPAATATRRWRMRRVRRRPVRPEAEGRSVTVDGRRARRSPPVSVDTFQVHQALLNLGTNAVQATTAGGTVRLTAATRATRRRARGREPGPARSRTTWPDACSSRSSRPGSDGTGLGLSIATQDRRGARRRGRPGRPTPSLSSGSRCVLPVGRRPHTGTAPPV